jgi:hypothetical protein
MTGPRINKVPKLLIQNSVVEFVQLLKSLSPNDSYVLNFKDLEWSEPFAILYLSEGIREFNRNSNGMAFEFKRYKKHGYLAQMGFFQSIGVDFGLKTGEAKGSDTYLPITPINEDELVSRAAEYYVEVGDIIEEETARLSEILTRSQYGELFDVIQYTLREIFRNVIEHSESKSTHFCAQYWPTKKKVELGIIDRGVGLRKGLANNPYLSIPDDEAAIKIAIMPGVSGKMYKGVKKRKNDAWQNSGYGLYMASRICQHSGSLFLTTNGAGLNLNADEQTTFQSCFLSGTAIKISLRTDQLPDLQSQLKVFAKEGHQIAKEISHENVIEASSASMRVGKINL